MTAATQEEKQAKADAKAEQEKQDQAVEAAKVADENAAAVGGTQAVAQAASLANQERRAVDLGQRQAAISVGNDPETASEVEGGEPVDDGPFAGQLIASKHYAVVTLDQIGRGIVEVRPEGWVGEGLRIPASRIKEVVKLLGKVKSLPEQDEE